LSDVLADYKVSANSTVFRLKNARTYEMSQPQPEAMAYQVAFLDKLLDALKIKPDFGFSRFEYPAGRSNKFKAQNGATIIDSTYNSNLSSATAILDMFEEYPAESKVLVLADMLEQGDGEAEEHEKLARKIATMQSKIKRVILLGPLMSAHALPLLKQDLGDVDVVAYDEGLAVLDDLKDNTDGDDTIFFKGSARFLLEGVIEMLLANEDDIDKLPRRTKFWQKKRDEKGLSKS